MKDRMAGRCAWKRSDARACVFRGFRLPASYANFYIANKIVLFQPSTIRNEPRRAKYSLAGLFPDREVVGIACRIWCWAWGQFIAWPSSNLALHKTGFRRGIRLLA